MILCFYSQRGDVFPPFFPVVLSFFPIYGSHFPIITASPSSVFSVNRLTAFNQQKSIWTAVHRSPSGWLFKGAFDNYTRIRRDFRGIPNFLKYLPENYISLSPQFFITQMSHQNKKLAAVKTASKKYPGWDSNPQPKQ